MPTHSLYLTNSTLSYIYKINGVVTQDVGGNPEAVLVTIPSAPYFTTEVSYTTITLTFAPATGETSIITDYQYSLDGGLTFNTMSSLNSPYTINDLMKGKTYYVKMKALNANGEGTASVLANIVTLLTTTSSAPTITTIIPDDASALLYFDRPTDNGGSEITNYKISTNNGGIYFYSLIPQTTSPITINNLTNGNTYQISIIAMNINGDGIVSNTSSVTLLIPPTILSTATNYFKFSSNFNNSISNALTLNGYPTSIISTISSKYCVSFSSNGFLVSNAVSSLPTLLSICYWEYHTTANNLAFSVTDGGANEIISQTLSSTSMIYNATNINSLYTGTYFNNQWNFIVHTINATGGANSQLGLYVNGIFQGIAPNTGTGLYPSFPSYYYYFGRNTTNGKRLNGGGIRHFMTFDTILTQQNVTDIMNYTT